MNKRKIYVKLTLDLVLLVLLALMYQKRAISMQFHEWGGIALCGLFLLHKALNWKWIRARNGWYFGAESEAECPLDCGRAAACVHDGSSGHGSSDLQDPPHCHRRCPRPADVALLLRGGSAGPFRHPSGASRSISKE